MWTFPQPAFSAAALFTEAVSKSPNLALYPLLSTSLTPQTHTHTQVFFFPEGAKWPRKFITAEKQTSCTKLVSWVRFIRSEQDTFNLSFPFLLIHIYDFIINVDSHFFWHAATHATSSTGSGRGRGREELQPRRILGSLDALQWLPQPWLRWSAGRTSYPRLNKKQFEVV